MENQIINQVLIGGGLGLALNAASFLIRNRVSAAVRNSGLRNGSSGKPLLPEDAIQRGEIKRFVEASLPKMIGYSSLILGAIEIVRGHAETATLFLTIAAPHLAQAHLGRRRK